MLTRLKIKEHYFGIGMLFFARNINLICRRNRAKKWEILILGHITYAVFQSYIHYSHITYQAPLSRVTETIALSMHINILLLVFFPVLMRLDYASSPSSFLQQTVFTLIKLVPYQYQYTVTIAANLKNCIIYNQNSICIGIVWVATSALSKDW